MVKYKSTEIDKSLPEFENPPVVEVALGVQFNPLYGLRPIELSSLRNRWRSNYPIVSDQPLLPPTIETSNGYFPNSSFIIGPSLLTRLWFLDEDESSLLQLQHDRFTVNWRKVSDQPYPRYRTLREIFESRFMDLSDLVSELLLGPMGITQVEVNYINAIEISDIGVGHLERAFRTWTMPEDCHLGLPDQARLALVFSVPGFGIAPVRLYVSVEPAQRQGDDPILLLTMTIRGAPESPDCTSALEFMDSAHEHIVTSFTELTPELMHQVWRRTR